MKTLFERRRQRRGAIFKEEGDWAGNALNGLAETRKRIDQHGIQGLPDDARRVARGGIVSLALAGGVLRGEDTLPGGRPWRSS
jgi:hypothetical protein